MTKLSGPITALVGFAVLIVGLLLGWTGRGLISYHDNVASVATYSDWRTACPAAREKTTSCQMVQDVFDQKTHSEIAQITVIRYNGKLVFALTLPFGVLLQPGVGLGIGSSPVKTYPYQTCNQVGCVATIPLEDDLLTSLREAKSAHIIVAGADTKPISLDFSVKGYNEATAAFAREESKRKSWFWRMWS